MKWYKNRAMYLFGLMGFLGGIVCIVLGLWLELARYHLPLSWWSVLYIHRTDPMIFVVDTSPLILTAMAALIGLQFSLSTAIIQGKKEWEIIFDSFSDPIFVTNENDQIARCNLAAADVSDFSRWNPPNTGEFLNHCGNASRMASVSISRRASTRTRLSTCAS